jgi:5'-nucleotidase (lipoprotein e(P4) family)
MKRRRFKNVLLALLLGVGFLTVSLTGNARAQEYTVKDLNEQLVLATLWIQRSAEFRALSYQAYNVAKMIFEFDLQRGATGKKRAVIVDIDDTVLDNSPYEAGIVDNNFGYPTGWGDWCNAGIAKALPGAVDFLKYVVSKGGDVFYLSNRKGKYKEGTMKNLKALGFPQVTDDRMLLREKTSDKEPRREIVRKEHRIVLLMGDNLNDFDNIFRKKNLDDRASAVDQVKDQFGSKFIVLPNPIYGDWEGGVYEGNWKLSPAEKDKARKAALIRWSKQ